MRGAKSSGVYREEASGLHASQLVSSEAVFSSQRALSELGHNASAAERVSVEEHHGEFCIARHSSSSSSSSHPQRQQHREVYKVAWIGSTPPYHDRQATLKSVQDKVGGLVILSNGVMFKNPSQPRPLAAPSVSISLC